MIPLIRSILWPFVRSSCIAKSCRGAASIVLWATSHWFTHTFIVMISSSPCRPASLHRGAATALLLLVSGCAQGTSLNRAETLLSASPPPSEGCSILWTPGTLPSVGELTDSAALHAAVSGFAASHQVSDPSTYVLFTVGIEHGGIVERLNVVEWLMPEGTVRELQEIVRRHLRAQRSGNWSVRLLVHAGAHPRFRVGRSERCLPRSRSRFEVLTPAFNGPIRPNPLRLNIQVDASGAMLGTQLMQGSGFEELDRWVLSSIGQHKFAPGTIDGVPVAMSYEQTIRLKSR